MKKTAVVLPAVLFFASIASADYNLVQEHYRWRNDDGSESAATWIAPMDTAATNQPKNTPLRLRLSIANTGNEAYDSEWNYFIYAEDTNYLNSETIPAVLDHDELFQMAPSPYITNREYTTEQLPGTGTFLPMGYCAEYPSNMIPMRLFADYFANYEVCLQGTRYAIGGKHYFITIDSVDDVSRWAEIAFASVYPTSQAQNIRYSPDYPNYQIQWEEGYGPLRIVVAKEGAVTNWWLPQDGVEYTATNNFAAAPDVGGGFRIVYKGTDDHFTLGGISNGTYSLRIYEYDGVSGHTLYNTNSAPGNPVQLEVHFAYTNYVGTNGVSGGIYFTNIQEAINNTYTNGTVLVSNGVYAVGSVGDSRVDIPRGISVIGVEDRDKTVILGGWKGSSNVLRCVHMHENTLLANVTLSNGYTYAAAGGGGVLMSSGSVLSNCVISHCAAYHKGGGINASAGGEVFNCRIADCFSDDGDGGGMAYGTIHNSEIINNYVDTQDCDGGGIYHATAYYCDIISNRAAYGGGAAWSRAEYCNFRYNEATYGGGIFGDTYWSKNCDIRYNIAYNGGGGAAQARLSNSVVHANTARTERGGGTRYGTYYNCTITYNRSHRDGGGSYYGELDNCIVYYNSSETTTSSNFYSGVYNYSCTLPAHSGTGNITNEPQLVSCGHISAASPCVGAGSASYAHGTDIDGESWNNPPSIGCDEIHTGSITGDLSVAVSTDHTLIYLGSPTEFQSEISGRPSNIVWNCGDGTTYSNLLQITHQWSATGEYDVVLTAFNETHPEGVADTVTVQIIAVDLALSKTGPASLSSGDALTYTIYVTNLSDYAVSNVTVTDTLPPGFTAISTSTVFQIESFAAHSETSFILEAQSDISSHGNATNVAVLTCDGITDPDLSNNTGTWVTTCYPSHDLAITKTSPQYVNKDSLIPYEITLSNAGPSTAFNVTITDAVPPEITTIRETCISNSVLVYHLNVNPAVDHTSIEDSSGEGNTGLLITTNSAPDTENKSITGVYDRAIYFDGTDDFIISSNILHLKDRSFSICFWARRDCTGLNNYVCGVGTNSDVNQALHIGFRNTDVFTFAFWANDLDTPGTYPDTNNWHHWACTYDADTRDRRIYYDGSLVAQNVASTNLAVDDYLYIGRSGFSADFFKGGVDDFLVFGKALSSNEVSDIYHQTREYGPIDYTDTLVQVVSELPPGDTFTWRLYMLPTNGFLGAITNRVSCGTENDTNTADNAAAAESRVIQVDLDIHKTGPTNAMAGETLTYTISITNLSAYPATNILVRDTLSSTSVEYHIDILEGSSSTSFPIQIQTDPLVTGLLTNHVSLTAGTYDDNTANNSNFWVTSFGRQADLTLRKTSSPYSRAGETITYHITVSNAGPSATSVVITDTVPEGVTHVWDGVLTNCMLVYNLNDNPATDGSTIADGSTNANNGTLYVSDTGDRSISNTVYDRAVHFDGSSDYILTGNPLQLSNRSFSICFWARRARTGQNNYICGVGPAGNNNKSLHVGFRDTGVFTFAFWANDLDTPGTYPDTNNWHHWACTYDADSNDRRIYYDGSLVAQNVASTGLLTEGPLYIGRAEFGENFGGDLDEFMVFGRALSSNEVYGLCTRSNQYAWIPRSALTNRFRDNPVSHCVVIYNFNENPATNGVVLTNESTNQNNAVLTTSDTDDKSVTGVYHGAMHFDGADDYALSDSNINLSARDFSICFWARRGGLGTYDLVCGVGTTTSSNHAFHAGFRDTDVFTMGFYANDLDTSATCTDTNNWHHWACTYDAATRTRKIYYDGALVAQDVSPADLVADSPLYIGRSGFGHSYVGDVDDFLLFYKTLTSNEVHSIYSRTEEYGCWITVSNVLLHRVSDLLPGHAAAWTVQMKSSADFSGVLTNLVACTLDGDPDTTNNLSDVSTLISSNLLIITEQLPTGITHVAYDTYLQATNGAPPYTWNLGAGYALPAGLSLSTNGHLSGTPTEAAVTDILFTATDNDGINTNRILELRINTNQAPVIDSRDPSEISIVIPEHTSRVFSITAHDPDGLTITHQWTWDGADISGATDSTHALSTDWGDAGEYQLRCYAFDGWWTNVYAEWDIRILDDNDGDGMKNSDERSAGTDPDNPDSFLGMLSLEAVSNGLRLLWQGGTSVEQYLEGRVRLSSETNAWQVIYTNTPPMDVTNQFIYTDNTNQTMFYRLRIH